MDSYVRLAKEIQSRSNPAKIGICVGEITNLTPITIRIYYAGTPLEFKEFFSIKGITDGKGITSGILYVDEYPVEIGDRFICIAGEDNQSLYVLGKTETISNLNIIKR
jgi:hypothetical protein